MRTEGSRKVSHPQAKRERVMQADPLLIGVRPFFLILLSPQHLALESPGLT